MKTWLVAHRGAPTEARENTLHAFEAAKKYPIGYIELDVRVTKDNIAIVHHDPNIDGQAIVDCSFSDLKSRDNNLATFEEAVRTINSQPLIVELKSNNVAKHVAGYLKKHPQSLATSFIENELLNLAKLGVEKKRLFLAQHNHPFGLVGRANSNEFGGITVNKWYATPWLMRNAQKHQLAIFIYTINNRQWAKYVRKTYPTVLVCTDYPNRFSSLQ